MFALYESIRLQKELCESLLKVKTKFNFLKIRPQIDGNWYFKINKNNSKIVNF